MPRSLRALLLAALASAVLAALPGAGPRAARADGAGVSVGAEIRVDRLSGDAVSGRRLVGLDEKHLTLEGASGDVDVPLDDIVEVSFPTSPDPPRAWSATEVAVDLWSGETVHGDLKGGDKESVQIETQLLGTVRLSLERISAVRFLQRLAQAAEPPDLLPKEDADVVHLVGGDSFAGTLEGFTERTVRSVTPQKDTVELPFERLVAVTFMSDERAKPKAGARRSLRAALRDGTRIAALTARFDGGKLVLESPSGFVAQCAPADVVALQVTSGRFAFLSDLTPATTEVKPVWAVAAGDPAVLFAPRFDRSFSGKPLRSGGRTWLDGIGVFSGTTLTWNLDGKFSEFRTAAGLDDAAGPLGGVVFQVLVDGKEAWTSGFVRPAKTPGRGTASPVHSPKIPLAGAKTLSLVVLAGDADDPYPVEDEADWLGPIVVRADAGQTPR